MNPATERDERRPPSAGSPRRPARSARRPSPPPDRRGTGCRRSCRGCARRDTRCPPRRAPARPARRSGARPSAIAACVTQAPSVTASARFGRARAVRQMPAIRTSSAGRASRRFSIGPSDWPPASRPRRPACASIADGFAPGRWAQQIERGGLHARPRAAMRPAMRRGVIGSSVISTPSGAQRVVHRVGDGGRRADRAALADALLAEQAVAATASPCGRCARPALRWHRAADSRRACDASGWPCTSNGISSYSAVPMPCAAPPITWPSTIIGLSSTPPSSTMT